jgi:peptidoglycan/xylan/chitin deacetylase (PgdA/CDA1 family)
VAPVSKTVLLRSGGYAALRRMLPSRQVAILRYHAICGPEGYAYADPGICITPEAFAQHVRYLAANYTVLPLPAVVDRLRTERPLPPNTVAITFDDGYADNLAAARMLKAHGLTATFFLTAGCLAEGAPFWPAEIRARVSGTRDPLLRLDVSGRWREIAVGEEWERRRAIRELTRWIKSHPIAVRESLLDQLRRAAPLAEVPRCMLGWNDVAEMQRMGMTIGAHTLTHPNLPSAGPVDAWQEIEGSKARVERELGVPVTMFAYPNGGAERYMTPKIASMVERAGFAAASTSRNGFAGLRSDRFGLERIQVQERLEDLVFALEVERFAFRPQSRAPEET